MTVRKSSYSPQSPSFDDNTNAFDSKPSGVTNQPEHLVVDSTDLPPIPRFTQRDITRSDQYQISSNPWVDEVAGGDIGEDLGSSDHEQKISSQTLQEEEIQRRVSPVLRGRYTPRSSLGSDEGHSVWAQTAPQL